MGKQPSVQSPLQKKVVGTGAQNAQKQISKFFGIFSVNLFDFLIFLKII